MDLLCLAMKAFTYNFIIMIFIIVYGKTAIIPIKLPKFVQKLKPQFTLITIFYAFVFYSKCIIFSLSSMPKSAHQMFEIKYCAVT